MIYGFIHPGSGLGNQLHRYVATRVLALDKGYEYSMIGKGSFRGKDFMSLDFGEKQPQEWDYLIDLGGKIIVDTHFDDTKEFNEKTNYYNPEFNFIEDNTIIDGEFQSIQYFGHRLKEIDEWLKVEPLDVPNDVCVINFRGGEYALYPELFLPETYWRKAIAKIRLDHPIIRRFEVHTDDPELADKFFGKMGFDPAIRDIGTNWRSLRYAKYAIIANTSFAILPRLLNGGVTIAPRYWARHNIKEWSRPDNYYKNFTYI